MKYTDFNQKQHIPNARGTLCIFAKKLKSFDSYCVHIFLELFLFLSCALQIAGFLGVLWCLSILSCLYSEYTQLPTQINPLILYGFMVLFLINPFKTCYYKSRFWLLKLLVSPHFYLMENLFLTLC